MMKENVIIILCEYDMKCGEMVFDFGLTNYCCVAWRSSNFEGNRENVIVNQKKIV